MRFLIAGLGSIGRRHLRNLKALGQEDILLYRTYRSTLPDEELAGLPAYTDLDQALAQHPDAVIIANPSAAHMAVAVPAAAAGCHLLIEKPIAPNLNDIPELRANLQKSGTQVLVGFHFRQHPVLKQIKDLLASKKLGNPLSVQAHWGEYLPDWHPWEDYRQTYAARADLGGGVVLTLSHPFDYLRWLLGEVQAVSAQLGRISGLELSVEDHADIHLRFQAGALGSLHLDYYQRPPSHWLEIACEFGLIHWDNASAAADVYTTETKTWSRLEPPPGFERNAMFLAEMAHFIRVCQGIEPPVCGLEDGVRALELTQAVFQSADKDGCLVNLG